MFFIVALVNITIRHTEIELISSLRLYPPSSIYVCSDYRYPNHKIRRDLNDNYVTDRRLFTFTVR